MASNAKFRWCYAHISFRRWHVQSQWGTYSEPHTMGRLFKVSREQDLEDLESTAYQQQEVKKSGVCACGCPPGSKNKRTEVRGYVAGFREQWFLKATSADAEQTNYNSCFNRGNGAFVCVLVCYMYVVMWRQRDREKDCVFLRKVGVRQSL